MMIKILDVIRWSRTVSFKYTSFPMKVISASSSSSNPTALSFSLSTDSQLSSALPNITQQNRPWCKKCKIVQRPHPSSYTMVFSWFVFLVSLSLCFFIKALFNLRSGDTTKTPKLPPGPLNIPILTTLQWLYKLSTGLEPQLRRLRSKYGPIFFLPIGHRKLIMISSHQLAHKALITHASTFADRRPAPIVNRYLSSNQHSINSAAYGPLWRLLRRNLTSEILHPSRVKSYAHARKWVLTNLINKLRHESDSGTKSISLMDHFQYAMFCLLVYMCFGDKLDKEVIRQIESVQRELMLSISKFNILNTFPRLGKIMFRKRWSLLYGIRGKQESLLLPLIRARREKKDNNKDGKEEVVAYVDTLLNLTLPEEGGRKLTEQEMVTLCSEFLSAGTDTTSTALQWIMANLVKHQDIQAKLFDEIKANTEVIQEDFNKMPYLKAVVLEGLRRHPPGHFVIPHAVTQEIQLEGYVIPKDASVNFMVAEMGWDPNVWKDPMEFKPERFMSSVDEDVFDITGSREIKMMPFGAGRRICPAFGLAVLHLEYFVANLVKEFKWTAEKGEEVDLSEKPEFTVVMKNPLRPHITPR